MNPDIVDIDYSNKKYNDYRYAEKVATFDGGAGTGATGTFALFTITGTIIARVIAVCTTTLVSAGGGDIEVGGTGNTDALIANTTATDIDSEEIWHDATPDSGIELSSVGAENIFAEGLNIFATIATGNITAGVIKFYVIWKPVSADGNLVVA